MRIHTQPSAYLTPDDRFKINDSKYKCANYYDAVYRLYLHASGLHWDQRGWMPGDVTKGCLKRMEIKLTQFEVKYFDREDWEEISEVTALVRLQDSFDQIAPLIIEMLNGKEIVTPQAVYRMKNCENQVKAC